ncbi:undecaprenyl-diphosphatase [Chitinophaga skermanii]|uniref:Undecaprenyl-diphosphatase n=1 Tax=Chitinophaga skermanii TaxID=331697 RepID=A0A327QFR7_9BACT|nr:phosphatase PAP2 family protein [Chitinophaga skermanii]RAJ02624.1 undecaprenyl-diphosphatase [Chitinophaga skermanii]
MLEQIKRLDLQLFFRINGQWTNSFFDNFLPWMREPLFWAPLYLFLIVFPILNYKWRGFFWIAFFLITFAISDQTSMFFKNYFERIRPCRDPFLADYVRVLVNYCPRSGSFTSSHAANHFSVATFCFFTMRKIFKGYTWLFFAWAAIIGYSQVYVGVHYPGDVLGGAVLGIAIGLVTSGVFQRHIRLELDNLT